MDAHIANLTQRLNEQVTVPAYAILVGVFAIFIIQKLLFSGGSKSGRVNHLQDLKSPKVVQIVKKDDHKEEKTVYCRCWKSSKFPLCDGTHVKHNEQTGDNVGPLIITRA